jgi:hypothetical protein
VTCNFCRLSEWKLRLYFRDILKSRYYVTFYILYTINNVWKIRTLLSTLHSHALRKRDFHTLQPYHTQHNHPSMTIFLLTSNRLRPRLLKVHRKPVCNYPKPEHIFSKCVFNNFVWLIRQMLVCDPKLLQWLGIFANIQSYVLNDWDSNPHTDKDSFRYRAQVVGPMQLTEWNPLPQRFSSWRV